MPVSTCGDVSFSPTHFVPVLEISGSSCYQTASQRSLPMLADSQRSYRYEYENADTGVATGVTTARCHGMSMNVEQGDGKWRRRARSCTRWYVAVRWRLTRGLFAVPLPLLTPYVDLKLGDVLITMPFIAMLLGYTAISAFQYDIAASGWPPTVALLLTFVFVVRNNSVLLALTGISFERALFYHKIFAVTAVLLAALHGWSHLRVLHNGDQAMKHAKVITGLVILVIMVLLLVLSLNVVRRRFFEFFVRAHWLLFTIVMVYAVVHGATLALFGISPWAIDMVYRVVYRTRVYSHGKPSGQQGGSGSLKGVQCGVISRSQVTMVKLAEDMLRIQFRRERVDTDESFEYKAGQYAFLCVAELSLLEWHPFTMSSSPSEATVTFHIKVAGDWTHRLMGLIGDEEVGKKVALDILVDGPYGGVSIDIYRPQTYSHIVLLSEGIGVLPMRSVVTWLQHECYTQTRGANNHVHFVWSVQNQDELKSLLNDETSENDTEALFSAANYRQKTSFSDEVVDGFAFDFYVAQHDSDVEASALDRCVHFGAEPDIHAILHDIGSGAKQDDHRKLAVLVSGSRCMATNTVFTCLKLSSELKVSFDVHIERFEF